MYDSAVKLPAMGKAKSEPDDMGRRLTIHLPQPHSDVLRVLSEQEDRTQTAILLRALRAYAKEAGIEWKRYPES